MWCWPPNLHSSYPDDGNHQVPHETIYRGQYIQAGGALKKEPLAHLRRTRAVRRSRHHTQKTADHGRITGMVSISERPATVEDQAVSGVSGHWEGGLLRGRRSSPIATPVESQSCYLMLMKVSSQDSRTVIDALGDGHQSLFL